MINQEKGQVLLVSVVIMVILALMALFMFDLQTTIRGKIKVETAEQSAALAAAEWQRKSLNLIGELNLVKASELMLTDFTDDPEHDQTQKFNATFNQIRIACRAMTEMQSRLSFVGPLIAFGAAQQAGKYNGVSIFDVYKTQEKSSFGDDEEEYQQEYLEDGNKKPIYDEIRNYRRSLEQSYRYLNYEYCHYYAWREPYKALLDDIRNRGLAVRGSGVGYLDSVDPLWMGYESLYNTVNYIAEYGVDNIRSLDLKDMGVLTMPDSFWDGPWWQVKVNFSGFKEQSEIYSLNISFSSSTPDEGEMNWLMDLFAGSDLEMLQSDLLPAVTWCTFASSWDLNKTIINEKWYDESYLREKVKPSFQYEGALAAATTYERISTLNNYQISMGSVKDPDEGHAKSLLKRGTQNRAIVSKRSASRFRIGTDYAFGDSAGAVAKVVGSLDDDTVPYLSSLVLPVFKTVTLVPSTMFNYTPFRSRYSNLERFLVWVKDLDTLVPPTMKVKDEDGNISVISTSPPNGTDDFYNALVYLNQRDFRYSIYNPHYNRGGSVFEEFFLEEYKFIPGGSLLSGLQRQKYSGPYSHANSTGAGWLQQAYIGPNPLETYRENQYQKYYRDNNSKGWFALKFNETDQFYTNNEEFYRYRRVRNSSSGYHYGENTGPSRL